MCVCVSADLFIVRISLIYKTKILWNHLVLKVMSIYVEGWEQGMKAHFLNKIILSLQCYQVAHCTVRNIYFFHNLFGTLTILWICFPTCWTSHIWWSCELWIECCDLVASAGIRFIYLILMWYMWPKKYSFVLRNKTWMFVWLMLVGLFGLKLECCGLVTYSSYIF